MSRKHSIRAKSLDNFACSGVYGIYCEPASRLYVGMSENILRRWTEHNFQLRDGNHPQKAIARDYKLHGPGNFIFIVIERAYKGSVGPTCRKDIRILIRELAAFWMFVAESEFELGLYNPMDCNMVSGRKSNTYDRKYRQQRYRFMTEDARLLIPESAVMGQPYA